MSLNQSRIARSAMRCIWLTENVSSIRRL